MAKSVRLRTLLNQRQPITIPGCWDAFTALLIEQAGFECAYLSGASLAYMRLGRSDIGLTGLSDVVEVTSLICDRVAIPLIVDIDDGYGNALNVQRTVRMIERAGAGAVQLEDQRGPKRCGHLEGKALVSAAEMVGKIHAALDARRETETVLIARTDAIAVEGFDAAMERADRYLEAGADVLFIEAPESRDQLEEIGRRFRARVPLLANMVEGGRTPLAPAQELATLGFPLVIFPGALARAFGYMGARYLESLKTHGSSALYRDSMLDFNGLNRLIGTPELIELGKRYDG